MGLLQLMNLKKETIYFSIILLIIGTLPFGFQTNGIFIILLAFYWLISGNWQEKMKLLRSNGLYMLLILFYFLHLSALLYTDDLRAGILEIEKKLPLLVLPLVLGSIPGFSQSSIRKLLWFFVLTCFITVIFSGLKIGYIYLKANQPDATPIIKEILPLHYPYFGMYLVFATLFVLHSFSKNNTRAVYLIKIGLVITFSLFIIFIGAKMAFASLLFIYAASLVTAGIINRKYNIRTLLLFCFLLIFSLGAIFMIPQSRERFIDTLNQFEMKTVSWKCGLNVLENSNLLIGAGPADVQELLQLCYYNIQSWMFDYNYNVHNQFIETAAGLGLVGFTVLLLLVCLPLYSGLRNRKVNTLLILFLSLFILSSLTESILQTNKGIVFFSLFYSILASKTRVSAPLPTESSPNLI